jgi:polyhydroxybutyrate depolymerase
MNGRRSSIPIRRIRRLLACSLVATLIAAVLLALGPGAKSGVAFASGCYPARPHSSGTTVQNISTPGGSRAYRVHVPPSYNGAERMPLIMNWHGASSNALVQEFYSEFSTRADDADGNFIVAYPQGLVPPLTFTYFNAWQLPSPVADDLGLAAAILDSLETSLCIDTNRVDSTGISNGAMMSVRLACSLSDRIAAFAPVAGAYDPPMALNLNPNETCGASRAVPMLAFHGTADMTVPFLGGPGGLSGATFTWRLPIDTPSTTDVDVMQAWAARNGCTSGRQESSVSAEVRLVTYDGCVDGATTQLYIVDGGGHTWPGAIDVTSLGYTTHDISATDLIWQFFQDHPLGGVALSDIDGDTVPDLLDADNDNDGCLDSAELEQMPGSEATGGLRDANNPYDFYDTSGDKVVDLFTDIFAVADAFGADADTVGIGEPDVYDPALDRSAPDPGGPVWEMHAPDGVIDLFTDIFGVAYQFGHDCSH